jgi:hypothetical protein
MATNTAFDCLRITFSAFTGIPGKSTVIFRDLEFDETHDYGSVANIVKGMARTGWDIHTVAFHTVDDVEYPSIDDAETLAAVFEALASDTEKAGQILAYGELFGWEASNFEHSRHGRPYDDGFYGVFEDEEEFAQEYVENTEGIDIPGYLVIDWYRTAQEIMWDFCSYEHGWQVYIFANH